MSTNPGAESLASSEHVSAEFQKEENSYDNLDMAVQAQCCEVLQNYVDPDKVQKSSAVDALGLLGQSITDTELSSKIETLITAVQDHQGPIEDVSQFVQGAFHTTSTSTIHSDSVRVTLSADALDSQV